MAKNVLFGEAKALVGVPSMRAYILEELKGVMIGYLEDEAKTHCELAGDSLKSFRIHSRGRLGGAEQPEVWNSLYHEHKAEYDRIRELIEQLKGTI